MPTRLCNFIDVGAIGSAKTALQMSVGPFSQNRLLLRLTPSSVVMNPDRSRRRTRAAGSSAAGSPRARPGEESLKHRRLPRRSRLQAV